MNSFRLLGLFPTLLTFFIPVSFSFAGTAHLTFRSEESLFFVRADETAIEVTSETSQKSSWQRILYKWTSKPQMSDHFFSRSNWVWVRFQDDAGFDLTFDLVGRDQFTIDGEHYGHVWVRQDKIKKLKQVLAEPISPEKFERLWHERDLWLAPIEREEADEKIDHYQKLEKEISGEDSRLWLNPLKLFRKKPEKPFKFPVEKFNLSHWDEEFAAPAYIEKEPFIRQPDTREEEDLDEEEEMEDPAEPVDYEGTPALYTLSNDPDRISEDQIMDEVTKFDAVEGMDVEVPVTEETLTNEDIENMLKEREAKPPTL